MSEMSEAVKGNLFVYNSQKLRENRCSNCRKEFLSKAGDVKMSQIIISQNIGYPSSKISISRSVERVFSASLKLQNISLANSGTLFMCLTCASTLSSLYRIYKKFMDLTDMESVMCDLMKESPFWNKSTLWKYSESSSQPTVEANAETPVQAPPVPKSDIKPTLPQNNFYDESMDDWQGDDSSHSAVDTRQESDSTDPRKTRNVQLDKHMTYKQKLEMQQLWKKMGAPPYCTYVPKQSTCSDSELNHPELRDLKRGTRICPYCKFKFLSMSELHDHLLNVSKIVMYECVMPDCNEKFAWDVVYAKHLAKVHSELYYIRGCERCPESFRTMLELNEHSLQHTDEAWISKVAERAMPETKKKKKTKGRKRIYKESDLFFHCSHKGCKKMFESKLYLNRHIENVHEPPPKYECDSCAWVFPRVELLQEHSTIHTGELQFSCDCGVKLNSKKSLENHIYNVHHKVLVKGAELTKEPLTAEVTKIDTDSNEAKDSTAPGKKFKCPNCNKVYGKRASLVCHIRSVHEGREPTCCRICGQVFATAEALERHEKTYEHIEFACEDCSKVFYSKVKLNNHADSHFPSIRDKEKTPDHICELCGRLFKNAANLLRHLKVHEEDEDD